MDDHTATLPEAFCSARRCELSGMEPGFVLEGAGNWAQFADGTLRGRQRHQGRYLCDRCVRQVWEEEQRASEETKPSAGA